MKINKMKTENLRQTLNRLTATQPPRYTIEDGKKVFTQFGKGNEAESHYAQHIREELARRSA
jgi:hypothetical protein